MPLKTSLLGKATIFQQAIRARTSGAGGRRVILHGTCPTSTGWTFDRGEQRVSGCSGSDYRQEDSYAFGPSHSPPSLLVNFEFENRVPPNNTVVVSATPSGNLSVSEFGTVRVVTNVIRQSLNQDSKVLGKVVGLVNSLKDGSIYLTFDFVYETRRLNGTIGMQGRLNAQGNGELEVTGGTGTFRFARGYRCYKQWDYLHANIAINNDLQSRDLQLSSSRDLQSGARARERASQFLPRDILLARDPEFEGSSCEIMGPIHRVCLDSAAKGMRT
ncbi:hypothetical protein AXG93_793s1040 [Marchantia polymorpha subsp. ruderalis]|uniref:Dirigent protein n=1 Tax=Marchantia polymorpha subsp. ruderalis TaxID=1480154 RepID=A0A176W0P2_MARPO|nr:hypothetical protein AXG93_793s1040 [Marchantia polymorpha subsp. ruderalis]